MRLLSECLLDSKYAGPLNLPFNRAYNTEKSIWAWYDLPGNHHRLARFAQSMVNSTRLTFSESITDGEHYFACHLGVITVLRFRLGFAE